MHMQSVLKNKTFWLLRRSKGVPQLFKTMTKAVNFLEQLYNKYKIVRAIDTLKNFFS